MKTKRKLILIISMLIAILTLSGCTKQEYDVKIGDNDSVTFTMRVLVDKESYDLMSSFGVDINELEEKAQEGTNCADDVNVLFQETAIQLNDYGFTIKPLNDAVDLGFEASKQYLTIEEFNKEIKYLCENNLSGLNLDIQYKNTDTKKEYKAYGTLNYLLDKDMGLDDETIKSYFDTQYDSSNMTASLTIMMPTTTQISAHDGTIDTNGQIKWVAEYNKGTRDVHIVSNFSDYSKYYIIGVFGLLIVAVISFFFLRAIKFKKEKQNSALSEEYEEEREIRNRRR